MPRPLLALSLGVVLLAALSACGPKPGTDGGTPDDAGEPRDAGQPDAGNDGGVGTYAVWFHYEPRWSGVTAVSVVGAFGQASDWTAPIATLDAFSDGGYGGFAHLPAGTYPYLFEVVGDADATPNTLMRFAVDGTNDVTQPCPSSSPTAAANPSNPCSELSVPQSPDAPPLYAINGTVTYDGGSLASYPVILERYEPSQHHYFVNRVETSANGRYHFLAASGTYRVQVWHPILLDDTSTDASRDPTQFKALRRALSHTFRVDAGMALGDVEMAVHDYGALTPIRDAGVTLPATFHLPMPLDLPRMELVLYGTPNGRLTNAGDPWYASGFGPQSELVFDGGFNTSKATTPGVVLGNHYAWGWEGTAGNPTDGGIAWTAQSMPFNVTFVAP